MFGVRLPLSVLEKPWEDISMDFVVRLPECEGFDPVWVVVDRLSKMRHFIPCHTTIDAVRLARIFLREVVRLHGLPRTIVLDRGPQFASTFWGQICSRLGIDRRLSTAFHPQTDGQTERMNAEMEQYLRVFVNHQQDDSVQWLPLAQFAANNGVSESTKCTSFFAVQGVNPRISFAGKQVSLYAYELELLASIRIHQVQPVSLLDPVVEDPLEGQVAPPSPSVDVDGEEEYQVSSVEDSRMYRNQLKYLIRWRGYDSLTWQPAKFVDGFQAVEKFHRQYPGKPGPLESALGGPQA
jgi:transposase InsO family protein